MTALAYCTKCGHTVTPRPSLDDRYPLADCYDCGKAVPALYDRDEAERLARIATTRADQEKARRAELRRQGVA